MSCENKEKIMDKLYLDNFRGFSNQFIPMLDVNFLIGENSTGKSSFLYALKVLSAQGFWFNQDFRGDEFQIHSFNDIVSAESNDKTYFKMGFISEDTKKPSFIMNFINKNGKPQVNKCIILSNKSIVLFKINKNELYYRKANGNDIENIDELEKQFNEKFEKFEYMTSFTSLWIIFNIKKIAIDKKDVENSSEFLSIFENISFIAPIRSKPKKTYDEPVGAISSEGDHIPYMIRDLQRKDKTKNILEELSNFGEESGLFKAIEVKEYATEEDAPFQINIVLNKTPLNIVNVGYGVAQSLPIISDILLKKGSGVIAIQQPEVHLHPKAQAALGDLFYQAVTQDSKQLFIETHSDFIVDRFRQKIRNQKNKKIKSHVLFFQRKFGKNIVTEIEIDKNGNYSNNQPDEFKSFFLEEERKNLGF